MHWYFTLHSMTEKNRARKLWQLFTITYSKILLRCDFIESLGKTFTPNFRLRQSRFFFSSQPKVVVSFFLCLGNHWSSREGWRSSGGVGVGGGVESRSSFPSTTKRPLFIFSLLLPSLSSVRPVLYNKEGSEQLRVLS